MSDVVHTEIGEIPSYWSIKHIEDLIIDKGISVGVMYPGKHDFKGIPLIKAGDVREGYINPNIDFFISEEVNQKYKRTILEGGELLVVLVGDPGLSAVVPSSMKGWNAARAIGVLKLIDQEEGDYISFALRSRNVKHVLKSFCNTTVQATLNLKELKQVPIPWPKKEEREQITKLLIGISNKIATIEEQNQTLEELAQTLFKRWFVEFEFTNENGQPYKSSGGKMVESELGEIPEGWRVGEVSDFVKHSTKSVSPGKEPNKIFSHYSIPAFDSGRYPTKDVGESILSNKYEVLENSILVSKLNPSTSRIWTVFRPCENGICSTEIQVFVPNTNTYAFSFGLFHYSGIKREMAQRASGTSSSHQRVRPGDILNIEFVVPKEEILKKFEESVLGVLRKIEENQEEIQSLTQLRDTLLPKLMSGELSGIS